MTQYIQVQKSANLHNENTGTDNNRESNEAIPYHTDASGNFSNNRQHHSTQNQSPSAQWKAPLYVLLALGGITGASAHDQYEDPNPKDSPTRMHSKSMISETEMHNNNRLELLARRFVSRKLQKPELFSHEDSVRLEIETNFVKALEYNQFNEIMQNMKEIESELKRINDETDTMEKELDINLE